MFQLGPRQERWLQALESGEFTQAQEAMCDVSIDGTCAYCCLGVAAQLLETDGLCEISKPSPHNGYDLATIRYGAAYSQEYLPNGMEALMGLRSVEGKLASSVEGLEKHEGASLATLNDEAEWDFKMIAQYIRQNPENVFVTSI